MKKRRFAVLGLGLFGQTLATELARLGCEVLAVDVSARKVDAVRDAVAMAAVADIRDRAALQELLTSKFDVAVIAIGGALEASIMATLHLRELGVEEVWAEGTSPDRAEVLTRVGATKVLSPERDLGRREAQRLANPNLLEFLPVTSGYGVVQVAAPAWTHGKTLAELDLRREMSLAVIAIRTPDGVDILVPDGAAALREGDILTVVGRDADIARFHARK
jgi:trk system potassium uptake protein TrkA